MRIWCALSGHGYGHVAQTIPVLNALAAQRPRLSVLLAGAFGNPTLLQRLTCPYELQARPQDAGLVQRGPFEVDLAASRAALRGFHAQLPELLDAESAAMAAWAPDLVLADIPYVALAAAHRLGVPSVALASLSWDRVVMAYFPPEEPEVQGWVRQMRDAYGLASLALRPAPALKGDTFPKPIDVPPIVSRAANRSQLLRAALSVSPQHLLGLIALGGIAPLDLPLDGLRAATGVIWLMPAGFPNTGTTVSLDRLPDWSFADLSASVDVVLGKPGYNTAVETVANRVPFLYLRRPIFPDEEPNCDWLAEHGAAREIDWETFTSDRLMAEVRAVRAQPVLPLPALDGADQAARHILALLDARGRGGGS